MVAAAQDVGTWARDDLKIPVPGRVEVNQSSRSHFFRRRHAIEQIS